MFIYCSESLSMLCGKWFKPTLSSEFELELYLADQCRPKGSYTRIGRKEVTQKKLEIRLDLIDKYWSRIFVYSDVDIQFFRTIKDDILSLIQQKKLFYTIIWSWSELLHRLLCNQSKHKDQKIIRESTPSYD